MGETLIAPVMSFIVAFIVRNLPAHMECVEILNALSWHPAFNKLMIEMGGIAALCSIVRWLTPLDTLKLAFSLLHKIADVETLTEHEVVKQAFFPLLYHAIVTPVSLKDEKVIAVTIEELIQFANHLQPESMEFKTVLSFAQLISLTESGSSTTSKILVVRLAAALSNVGVLMGDVPRFIGNLLFTFVTESSLDASLVVIVFLSLTFVALTSTRMRN